MSFERFVTHENTTSTVLFMSVCSKFSVSYLPWTGRVYMYYKDSCIAEKHVTSLSLEEANAWLTKVKQRDLKRLDRIDSQIKALTDDKKRILGMWSKDAKLDNV